MEVVKRERVIPECVATYTVYVASDGTEYWTESECEAHEKMLEVHNHPVYKSRIRYRTFYDDYSAELYYLRSEEDFEFWAANIGTKFLEVNQWEEGHGPGWYLFCSVEGGDYADSNYLYKLEEYEKFFREMIDSWSQGVQEEIAAHMLEEGHG